MIGFCLGVIVTAIIVGGYGIYHVVCLEKDVAKLEAENKVLMLSGERLMAQYGSLRMENEKLKKALKEIMDISYPAGVHFIALNALEK